MDIIGCDGCDKQSPDHSQKGGPHIANHWTKVIVKNGRRRSYHREFMFCEECLSDGASSKSILKVLKEWMGF